MQNYHFVKRKWRFYPCCNKLGRNKRFYLQRLHHPSNHLIIHQVDHHSNSINNAEDSNQCGSKKGAMESGYSATQSVASWYCKFVIILYTRYARRYWLIDMLALRIQKSISMKSYPICLKKYTKYLYILTSIIILQNISTASGCKSIGGRKVSCRVRWLDGWSNQR